MNPNVKSFYHQDTYTWTHVISCPNTKLTTIIDPVLDYNHDNANTSTPFIDKVLSYLKSNSLKLQYVLETHAHADHLTSAAYIIDKIDAQVGIGANIVSVQKTFKELYNFDDTFKTDGSQFQLLLRDGESLTLGEFEIGILHTPGHTDDSMSFTIGDFVFIGDTLFSPDYGTARCDFPGGDAEKLFNSIQNIYSLGMDKKLYLCHDYPDNNRQPRSWYSSAEQQQYNIHITSKTKKSVFCAMRNKRDLSLDHPKLIIPAIQVNLTSGKLLEPGLNGKPYLKMPINTFAKA